MRSELIIPRNLTKLLKRRLKTARRKEIGGILLAEQLSPGLFQLVDCTFESRVGTRSQFRRSEAEHRDALREFMKKNGNNYDRFNYLGEWHSHPSFTVHPSLQDQMTMQKMVMENASIPFAVLLIVKLSAWYRLNASATVFERGKEPYSMEITFLKKIRNRGINYG